MRQIEHLFMLMDMFADKKTPLTVKQIVDHFGWPRSTVFNMVKTLVDLGYLFQPMVRGGYFPTDKWQKMGQIYIDVLPLPVSVHEFLMYLQSITGETVLLVAMDKDCGIILDVAESKEVIRYSPKIGESIPLLSTAAGKVLLSQMSNLDRRRLIGNSATFEDVLEQFTALEQQGWLASIGQYSKDLGGVAVPFPIYGRKNVIALGGPVGRVEHRIKQLGDDMAKAVHRFIHQ